MIDRLTVVIGAGVLTAGVSAGLLAGAGVAAATTETATGSETTTSESSESEGKHRSGSTAPDADDTADTDDVETDTAETDTDDADETVVDTSTSTDTPTDTPAADDDEDAPVADAEQDVVTDEAVETVEAVPAEAEAEAQTDTVQVTPRPDVADAAVPVPERLSVVVPTAVVEPLATLTSAASASQTAATPARQTLLSLIGTAIFNIYSLAIRVLGGPPILPRDSTVTVRSSSLRIDCGQGYDVPADWYVPDGPTPTRLIHLQHGFLASGAFYSYTAARLAEATHSIVVATSLTSNFLACDGCWVGGSPMHKAVADLFVDGNTALAQSALAAGYSSTLLDGVQKVALVGHSAGGGLAAGAAGFMTQNGTFDRLAGVVMLDGVGFGDVTPVALAKLPQDFPIYNLGARAYYWNMSGTTNTVMNDWRSGGFNGVKLAGGSHGDSMTGGNPLIQVAMNLVTGWPKPENARAAEVISAGWLNDMFSGTAASGYYGVAGDTLAIETDKGTATAHVLPGPTEPQTIIDLLFTFGAKILFGIDFATCAADPEGGAEEFSAPNTLLSLDGRAKPGQSIGQQCVHG